MRTTPGRRSTGDEDRKPALTESDRTIDPLIDIAVRATKQQPTAEIDALVDAVLYTARTEHPRCDWRRPDVLRALAATGRRDAIVDAPIVN